MDKFPRVEFLTPDHHQKKKKMLFLWVPQSSIIAAITL